MALYRNITDSPRYICSSMNKVLIKPNETVELSERDLAHAGYALVNFESVAIAKDVADQKMAELKRTNRFVKPEAVKPEAVKPEAVKPETIKSEPAPAITK